MVTEKGKFGFADNAAVRQFVVDECTFDPAGVYKGDVERSDGRKIQVVCNVILLISNCRVRDEPYTGVDRVAVPPCLRVREVCIKLSRLRCMPLAGWESPIASRCDGTRRDIVRNYRGIVCCGYKFPPGWYRIYVRGLERSTQKVEA